MASVDDKSSEVRTKFIVQMQLYVVFLKMEKILNVQSMHILITFLH